MRIKLFSALVFSLLLICGMSTFMSSSVHAAANEDTLYPNQVLYQNQMLINSNCSFVLFMQADGNLVEQDPIHGWRPVWATGTEGHPGSYLVNQGDGNLVIFAPDREVLWSSDTWGHPGSVLTIQNDANVVIYAGDGHRALWSKSGVSNVVNLTQWEAQTQLNNASIATSSSHGCTNRNDSSCTSLDSIRRNTIRGIIGFKQQSNCPVTITAGTEIGHVGGTYSHYNGYKVDIDPTCVSDAMNKYRKIAIRGDGAPQWVDQSGNIYAFEYWENHFDVLYY